MCVVTKSPFCLRMEKMKGRAEGREEGERGEGERGEGREEEERRGRERRNRREKGKDKEEGCNYGLAHNLGCSKETFKLQLSSEITVLGMEADDTKFLRFSSDLMSPVKFMLNINVVVSGRN